MFQLMNVSRLGTGEHMVARPILIHPPLLIHKHVRAVYPPFGTLWNEDFDFSHLHLRQLKFSSDGTDHLKDVGEYQCNLTVWYHLLTSETLNNKKIVTNN